MAALSYQVISKEVENHILKYNWILFSHTCMYKYSNYNIFVQIWYSYFRYTGRFFLNVLSFLLAVILSELHEKQEGNIELQKKVHRRICMRDITFLTARPPSYVIFCCFLSILPSPSQFTYLLNGPYKDT